MPEKKRIEIFGGALDGAELIEGYSFKILGINFCWWGWSGIHKWRWHGTHIDLGAISVYEIKHQWLWLPLAWVIKPLRMFYHWRYCNAN